MNKIMKLKIFSDAHCAIHWKQNNITTVSGGGESVLWRLDSKSHQKSMLTNSTEVTAAQKCVTLCNRKSYAFSWCCRKHFNDFIFGCILLQSLLYTAGVWSVKFVDRLSARILINQYKLNNKVKGLSRLLESINDVCPKGNLYLSLNMWTDDHIFRINTWKSQKMLMFIFCMAFSLKVFTN